MCKKKIFLYFILAVLSYFSFNLMTVQAYFTSTSEQVVNQLSVADFYEDTYTYNLVNSDGTTTKLEEKVIYKAVGDTVDIVAPSTNVSNYTLQSITINGSGSYSIGDTYTQPRNDLSIVYTYRPTFTVTYTGDTSNYSYSGATSGVAYGSHYSTTITLGATRNIDSYTITMGGRTLIQGTDYTYSQNTATRTADIVINNVTGNITFNIQTKFSIICLAEGTNVMLWDGSTKKIEDIKYNDLLKVWNHDTGSYGYEYAGWIEKPSVAYEYLKVSFSDGSELKVVGDHSIFSKTKNKYVNVQSDEFNIGDEVVNLKDGIKYVKVTNIEHVNEEVKYYHIISSRYFNIITNNILSTYEIYNNVSNFMDFGENLKWLNTEEVRRDMFTYDDLPNMDYYLFKVFRLEETKYLLNKGLVSQDEFNDLYQNYLLNNDKKVKPPTDNNGKYLWMVTTSDDDNPTNTSHQLVEGSNYEVPTPEKTKNFLYWYNHSDNKTYQPGDIIKVDSSMYLEAIYK